MTYWHLSPRRNRESIEAQGLLVDADSAGSPYVWVFDDREVAEGKTSGAWGGSREIDLWEVDLDGFDVEPDPHPGWTGIKSWVVDRRVPAGAVTLQEAN
jgi:hypothetical protein